MTSDSRKKMLERIRAMMNTDGRTEAEMMAFLIKARELMATYEIDETELNKFEQEKATLHRGEFRDPYDIKKGLCVPVANFTRCKGWDGSEQKYGISFAGLESDVIFATWLLDTLQRFIMRALREFQKQRSIKKLPNSNYTSASFVVGCTIRIAEKLKELTLAIPAKNKEIITAELAKNGIILHKGRRSDRQVDQYSAMAGHNAGNHARFDKPVGEGGIKRLK